MSQIYSIKNLLNIKDKNITFTENGISMENFKGVYSKIIHAKISLDRFHLVQLINRSFNKTRIKIMNQCKNKDERYYNKLKKFWSLLLKNCLDLKTERINRGRMFDYAFRRRNGRYNLNLTKSQYFRKIGVEK